jgi:hypothetical protein
MDSSSLVKTPASATASYDYGETNSDEEKTDSDNEEKTDSDNEDIAPSSPTATKSFIRGLAGRGIDKIRSLVARKVTLDTIYIECDNLFSGGAEPLQLVLLFADFGFTYRVLVDQATGAPLLIKATSPSCLGIIEQLKKYVGNGLSTPNDMAQIVQQSILVASKGVRRYMLVPLQSQKQRRRVINKLSSALRVAEFNLALSTQDSVSKEINIFILKRRRALRRKLILALVTTVGILLAMIWRFREFLGITSVQDAISSVFSFLNGSVSDTTTTSGTSGTSGTSALPEKSALKIK